MPTSNKKKGAYYLAKTIAFFKKQGWKVEKLEVTQSFPIKGKIFWGKKRDLLGADCAIWNDTQFYLVQVKSGEGYQSEMLWHAEKQFKEWAVPLNKIVVIWKPKQKPLLYYLDQNDKKV